MVIVVGHNYSDSGVPAPGDGLRVIRLSHHGNAHRGRWPVECQQCGKEVAVELRRLGVGSGDSSLPNSPTPLSYRDVFIITRSSELQDDIEDDAGQVTSRASGVVRGLRDEGLPVCVLGGQDWIHNRARWERDVDDVAVAATDRVTVTDSRWVQGLERRVVVMLSGRDKETDEGLSDKVIDLSDRLLAASRCSTQLIMVDVPPVTTATSTATWTNVPATTIPSTTTAASNITSIATTTTTTTTTVSVPPTLPPPSSAPPQQPAFLLLLDFGLEVMSSLTTSATTTPPPPQRCRRIHDFELD
ncbi:uncharacterized protein [Littorina saxatilis]|uniref:uncharacterized protein n=1 Tax=Littorina saxatilis TaxID=31220 RepID=UPI0038B4EBED